MDSTVSLANVVMMAIEQATVGFDQDSNYLHSKDLRIAVPGGNPLDGKLNLNNLNIAPGGRGDPYGLTTVTYNQWRDVVAGFRVLYESLR